MPLEYCGNSTCPTGEPKAISMFHLWKNLWVALGRPFLGNEIHFPFMWIDSRVRVTSYSQTQTVISKMRTPSMRCLWGVYASDAPINAFSSQIRLSERDRGCIVEWEAVSVESFGQVLFTGYDKNQTNVWDLYSSHMLTAVFPCNHDTIQQQLFCFIHAFPDTVMH